MNRMLTFIEKRASWKTLLILALVSTVLATLIITMLFGALKVNPEASMDSETYYTSKTFYKYLDLQGEEGRKSYLLLHLIDYCFIIFFYSTLAFTLYILLKKQKTTLTRRLRYAALIPYFAALCDLGENLCIDLSIIIYPSKVRLLSVLSGYFTATKMSTIYLAFTMILLMSLLLIISRVKTLLTAK